MADFSVFAVINFVDLEGFRPFLKKWTSNLALDGTGDCFWKFGGFGPPPIAATAEARVDRPGGSSPDSRLKEEHHRCSYFPKESRKE